MSRPAMVFVIALVSVLVSASPASAKCGYEEQASYVEGFAQIEMIWRCDREPEEVPVSASPGPGPPRTVDIDRVCVREAIGQGLDPLEFCGIPPEDVERAEAAVTPDLVAAAMRRVRVPGSELVVQPPGGRTLVNFETNFYTVAAPLTRRLSLLGQRVALTLTPASYTWRFGDGSVEQTQGPGAAYPELDVTHVYASKQEARPNVTTTWTATYRLNGGPSRPVPGSLTIPGETVALEVVTARPRLVG